MNPNAETPKNAVVFVCKSCDFKCRKESEYKRHILTRKHKILTNPNDILTKKTPDESFTCKCGKIYKHLSSLCNHKKKCNFEEKLKTIIDVEKKVSEPISTECVLELIKQNKELQITIVEQSKTIAELANKPTSITNTNCNNNNRFNINFFLNEQCKNAMNITDFVNSLKLTLNDLEKTGELGYVKGLTNIIVNGLNELDVYQRPIHCSDIKRETMYIKDNDAWAKENSEKTNIKRMIKHISYKNAKQVGAWTKENKGYNDSYNKKNDKYLKIVSEANSGEDDEVNKIISNITPSITIDKDNVSKKIETSD
jgi:hypothetical protein